MKYALCIRGISFLENYEHWHEGVFDVDFSMTAKNIHDRIIDNLRAQGHQVDIFLASYTNSKESEVVATYKPVGYIFNEPFADLTTYQSIAANTMLALSLAEKTEKLDGFCYDHVIITRFDAAFSENFCDLNIDPEKFNFLCRAQAHDPVLVDDNFWVVPHKFLPGLNEVLSEITLGMYWTHEMLAHLQERIGDNVHFMYDGNYLIRKTRPLIKFGRELIKESQKS